MESTGFSNTLNVKYEEVEKSREIPRLCHEQAVEWICHLQNDQHQRGASLKGKVRSLILDILCVRCLPVRHSNGDAESQGIWELGLRERSRLKMQIGEMPAYQ